MIATIYYLSDIHGLIRICTTDWLQFVNNLFPCDRIKIKKITMESKK